MSEIVEVTQADRDAAVALGQRLYGMRAYSEYMTKHMDNWIVQAFAQHRLAASERSHVGEWEAMRSALEPFVALADKRDAKFRKRGGDPDAFPDTHPAYDIKAHELPATVWRKARAALANNT